MGVWLPASPPLGRRQFLASAAAFGLSVRSSTATGGETGNIVAWGDSLTAQGYPELAGKLFDPSRQILNRGVGGQGAESVAVRQGGLPLTVTFADGRIPAWDGEQDACPANCGRSDIVAKSNNILFVSGTFAGSAAGEVAGVAGTIRTDPKGNWRFHRKAPGTAVTVAPDTAFLLDEPARLADRIQWIWVGRNDLARPSAVADVLGCIEAMVRHAGHDRFLVCAVINGAGEGRGTAVHARVVALNRALADRYGVRFVDVRTELIAKGNAERDADDMASDVVPSSLRADTVHLLPIGLEIVARMMHGRTLRMGW